MSCSYATFIVYEQDDITQFKNNNFLRDMAKNNSNLRKADGAKKD